MTSTWDEEELDELFAGSDEDQQDTEAEVGRQLDQSHEPQILAALPGGVGSLVVGGRGTGTTVLGPDEAMAAEARSVQSLRSRDEALSLGTPLVMVHRPHQRGLTIPHLLASVVGETGGAVSVGAAVSIPAGTSIAHQEWLNSCRAASVKIADPAGYNLDGDIVRIKTLSGRAARYAPYLSGDPLSIDEVLTAQRSAGANLLLSPGRALDPTDPDGTLDAVFAEADQALARLESGERLALNLTLTEQWLTSPTLRTALFSQLLDQEQFDVWYIRTQWKGNLGSLQQPTNLSLLQGYKRLAQLAADEERVLLLPQTGLTGWLQLGFGATGFGVGPFGASHAFREHRQGGNGGREPIPRYFEPSLLHAVERSVHDALARQDDYVPCTCPYCPGLVGTRTGNWNHELARLHHLHALGTIAGAAVLSGRTTSASVRRIVRAAVDKASTQPLAGISAPRHLQVWDQLL